MKLIVISPESEDTREHAMLVQLFAAGLTDYHLRKPSWSRDQLAAFLCVLPAEFHPRVVLHTHHDLATEFVVGGLHDRDHDGIQSRSGAASGNLIGYSMPMRSRAVHDLVTLRASLDCYDRVLVSPIFSSLSKPGHAPDGRLNSIELKTVLTLPRRAEAFALGGINAARIAACRDLGFDGVAVLGAIWHAAGPVAAFSTLQRSCGSELARDSLDHREQARSHD